MGTGEQAGREIGSDSHHWTESRDLRLELTAHGYEHGTGLGSARLDWMRLGWTRQERTDRTGKGGGGDVGKRLQHKEPTACSRCNSGGPRPGNTLGGGVALVCLPILLFSWLAGCLSPTRAWGRSEGFARWGQLK